MATDPYLLERIRQTFKDQKTVWTERSMFGGHCFMVDEKMCVGTFKGGLMARVDPHKIPDLINKTGTTQMTMGGKTMKGYLQIAPTGYDHDEDLEFWINECLEFNPKAKSSKKK